MTDFFETRVVNLEPNEDRKKSSVTSKKSKRSLKKRKWEDSDSSVVECSEESTKAHRPIRKYCILHSTDNCKDPRAMVSKHKQKKKKPFQNYEKSNKELNALIEKKFQEFITNKGGKQRRSFNTFKKYRFQMMKEKRASPAWQKA